MMKNSSLHLRVAVAIAATLLLIITVAARNNQAGNAPTASAQQNGLPPQSIYFTVMGTSNLSTFLKAVKAAGLEDTLKGSGPFTVFAPTDEAFAKLPAAKLEELFRPENREMLKDILTAHILPVKASAAEMAKLKDVKTLKRNSLPIDSTSSLKVGGASVTQSDIKASNGVIHLIDAVLMPTNN